MPRLSFLNKRRSTHEYKNGVEKIFNTFGKWAKHPLKFTTKRSFEAIVFLIVFAFITRYVFALFSKFETSIKTLWKNALLIGLHHIGWSLLMVVIFAAFTALIGTFIHWPLMMQALGEEGFKEFIDTALSVETVNPLGLFSFLVISFLPPAVGGYGLTAYFDSYILNRVFKPYVQQALENSGVEMRDPEDDTWNMPEENASEETETLSLPENAPEEAHSVETETEEAPEGRRQKRSSESVPKAMPQTRTGL